MICFGEVKPTKTDNFLSLNPAKFSTRAFQNTCKKEKKIKKKLIKIVLAFKWPHCRSIA